MVATYAIKPTPTDSFPEAFAIVSDTDALPADAKTVADALARFIATLSSLPTVEQGKTGNDKALTLALINLRTGAATWLLDIAKRFCNGHLTPDYAIERIGRVRGRYNAEKERLETALFVVAARTDERDKACDIEFRINTGGIDDTVPPDKQTLFVDLTNALTIVNACCDRMMLHASRSRNERMKATEEGRARNLRDEFVRKLAGCGIVGLNGTHPALAQAALSTLKAEFYARNSGTIKKAANNALALWAFGGAIALIAPYFICRWLVPTDNFFQLRKEFFLLAAGAAIGTWLSFSIRNLDLTFEDLGKFEDEFLGPWVRVVFVVTLAIVVGLLFWTKAFAISIGDMKVMPPIAGGTAILVGMFCGLSERALATAVSARAATFIKGVAGTNG